MKDRDEHCGICGGPTGYPEGWAADYPGLVCRVCDGEAIDARGRPPRHDSGADSGDDPVFIRSRKCWRRYRFGGYVTMVDPEDHASLVEFLEGKRRRDS